MLDIQFIRDNPDLVAEKAKQKGYVVDVDRLLRLDKQRKEKLTNLESARSVSNEYAKQGKPDTSHIATARELRDKIKNLEDELKPINVEINKLLKAIPNMPLDNVPVGASEDENKIIKTVGDIPKFDFKPLSDEELGKAHDYIDKERAVKVAGPRFAYVKGELVRLQFAIIQFVFDVLTDQQLIERLIKENNLDLKPTPFTPILPPAMVKTGPYEASGRLNAEEVTYRLTEDDLWMNASAEHSLCTMYADEILDKNQLPIRYIGYATSFRREAGTYGKDSEGIFRMHQFDKLEMEVFSTPETGKDEHKLLVVIQEYLVQQLQLPYQLIQKCTADIGKPNAQGIDINIWMPAQGAYRETHTADYMTDYQARSLKTRTRDDNGETQYVHTNDATAFALGRTVKAIIENYQNKDGSIRIPNILKPYMKV